MCIVKHTICYESSEDSFFYLYVCHIKAMVVTLFQHNNGGNIEMEHFRKPEP